MYTQQYKKDRSDAEKAQIKIHGKEAKSKRNTKKKVTGGIETENAALNPSLVSVRLC